MIIIEGDNNIRLRLVQYYDASFIFELRSDKELNQYLSQITGTVEDQVSFIKNYKEKESNKIEYYFIIEYKYCPVGTLRLYNIDYKKSSFTWGSWIIKRGNPVEVALSSAYMSYYFAYNELGLNKAEIDVKRDNKSVFKFHAKYCEFLYEDEVNYYLELKKENLSRYENRFIDRIPKNITLNYE